MPAPLGPGRAAVLGRPRGFLPTDLPGLVLWLAANKISGLSDGDPVTTWSDASGNGNNATQATAAKKPTFKVNILNGKPVVRFDGVDDWLALPLVLQDAKTVVLVAKLTSTPGAGVAYSVLTIKYDTSTFSEWLFINIAGYEEVVLKHDFLNSEAGVGVDLALDTSAHIWRHTYDNGSNTNPASYAVVKDGTAQTVVANGSVGRDSDSIGSLGARTAGTDSTLPAYVDLAEVLVYNRVVSAAEASQLDSYCNSKWAV